MAKAWGKNSDIWQYNNTIGDHTKANKVVVHHKLRVPEEGKKIYEEVAPNEVKEDRNHIVVYDGENKIMDSDVPQFAKRATHWDSVTRLVPDFSEEMFIISDLMYRVESPMTEVLNHYLGAEGLHPVKHLMQAINRLNNASLNIKESKALRSSFQGFLHSIGGTISGDVFMAEWATCRDWQCKRVSIAHPLNLASLEDVKNKISSDEGFAKVREIALIMVNFAIKNNL